MVVVLGGNEEDTKQDSIAAQVRNHLVVVFSDLANSTQLSEGLEPEEYGKIIQKFRERAYSIVTSYGGLTIRTNGDDLFFVFGYPDVQQDPVKRAIDTCMELNQVVSELEVPSDFVDTSLKLRSGIHSGVVLVSSGSLESGTYDLLGEPINVAKKLCDEAQPSEILISEASLGGERHKFSTSGLFKFRARRGGDLIGYRKITSALDIENDLDARLNNLRTTFAGREDELDWLSDLLRSSGKATSLLNLIGEAGIGKTRLLREFVTVAGESGAVVFSVTCQLGSQQIILKPIQRLAKAVLLRASKTPSLRAEPHKTKMAPYFEYLSRLFEFGNSNITRANIRDLADAIVKALEAVSAGGPVVLIFDDWQWSDEFSEVVLESLAKAEMSPGLLIVLASREMPRLLLKDGTAQQLKLEPLDTASIHQTISSLVTLADPSTVQRIVHLSGGNPLFVEELCHAAADGEVELQFANKSSWLHTLISARYSKLDESAASVLRTAAVLGNRFSKELLCRLADLSNDDVVFSTLEYADFLFPADSEGELIFKHGLTRETVYSLVGLVERKMIHKEALAFIQSSKEHSKAQDIDHELAHHYAGCGLHENAVRHALAAGDAAFKSSALGVAQNLFGSALDQYYKAGGCEVNFERIITRFGRASIVDPSWEQIAVLERAARWARKQKRRSDELWCQYWTAFILYGVGEPKESLALFEQIQYASRNVGEKELATRVQLTMGQVLAANSDYSRAEPALLAAIDAQRAFYRHSGNPGALAYSLGSYAFACADQGRFGDARLMFDEAVSILDGQDHEVILSVLGYRAVFELWQGCFSDAAETSREVVAIAGRMRSRYIFNYFNIIGRIAEFLTVGNPDSIDAAMRISLGMRGRSLQRQSIVYGYLAECYAQIGNFELARQHAAGALLRVRKSDFFGEAQAYRAAAIVANARQQTGVSESYFQKALMSSRRRRSTRDELLVHALADVLQVNPNLPDERPPCPENFRPHAFYLPSQT